MTVTSHHNEIYKKVVDLLYLSKQQVVRQINVVMVQTYFEIGRTIIEEEQNGQERAAYGKALLKGLSKVLTKEFGRGFSVDNLEKMRRFYLVYSTSKKEMLPIPATPSRISATPSRKLDENLKKQSFFNLSWSHYVKLMRIDDENARQFYEIESLNNNWSVRELERQINSALFERLALSKDKNEVIKLSKTGMSYNSPKDLIKDPYILEFINLPEKSSYTENELEEGIINKLEQFLLELGTGFTFVSRQKRITFDDKHFYIDLVFFNRMLKCFVLVDLKIGELKHQDIGQMQMYVNYFDREMRLDDENKTIGVILCQNKSDAVVEYTLPENNEQIFASKYKTILPSKEEFKALIKNTNNI